MKMWAGGVLLFSPLHWVATGFLHWITVACRARKYGCGWEGVALASNAAWFRTRCPMQLPARQCCVWVFFSLGFTPMWLDSCQIDFDSHRIGLIWPELGRIGHIGLYQLTTDTAKTCQKRPKLALKLVETAEILTLVVFLAFFFLCFVNQGIVMCFLRIF